MDDRRRKLLIAGIIVFLVLCVAAIIVAVVRNAGSDDVGTTGQQTTTIDPVTGESITETDGKGPETLGNDGVTVLGISKLLDYGVSSDQTDLARTTLNDYGMALDPKPGRISVDVSGAQSVINEEGGRTITAQVVLDNSTRYRVSFAYASYNDMLVRIYNADGGEIFNSAQDDINESTGE